MKTIKPEIEVPTLFGVLQSLESRSEVMFFLCVSESFVIQVETVLRESLGDGAVEEAFATEYLVPCQEWTKTGPNN